MPKAKKKSVKRTKKFKKKTTCSEVKNRTEKGQFPKGVSGNPGGRHANVWHDELEESIKIVQKRKRKKLLIHAIERAYKNDRVLVSVLKKLLPDLRTIEGEIKATLSLVDIVARMG